MGIKKRPRQQKKKKKLVILMIRGFDDERSSVEWSIANGGVKSGLAAGKKILMIGLNALSIEADGFAQKFGSEPGRVIDIPDPEFHLDRIVVLRQRLDAVSMRIFKI